MCLFEVLGGLPAYGPPALPFPKDGNGGFREGPVVRFQDASIHPWTGNFQRGFAGTSSDFVLHHPDGRNVIVIAGGAGYVVDPASHQQIRQFGGGVNYAQRIDPINAVLIGDGLNFETITAAGLGWRSERISWDGIRNIVIEGGVLRAEAWSPMPDMWRAFELDLLTGRVIGRIYGADMARIV